jgi:L-fuculose-phosphate aldolase
MNSVDIRQEIVSTVRDFNTSGISIGTSGNVSVRQEKGFLITPTGIVYSDLTSNDVVLCNYDGDVLSGELKPSSEWPFHAAIYKNRSDVNAIVHTHPPYATGIACARKPIPAFNYMIAIAGGDSIRCAEYATFGTEELSNNLVEALLDRKACLLANHGMVAVGESIKSAYKLAHEVEMLAKQYCISLSFGTPALIDEAEMKIIIEKFKLYGKQNNKG